MLQLMLEWIAQLLMDDRYRLSRIIAIPSALLALLIFVYGIIAPHSFWIGTGLAILLGLLAIGVWKLGDWWQRRQELRKAQDAMSSHQRD